LYVPSGSFLYPQEFVPGDSHYHSVGSSSIPTSSSPFSSSPPLSPEEEIEKSRKAMVEEHWEDMEKDLYEMAGSERPRER
jgi:hypothetical protein